MKKKFAKVIALLIIQTFLLTNNLIYALAPNPAAILSAMGDDLVQAYGKKCVKLVNHVYSTKNGVLKKEIDRLKQEKLDKKTIKIAFPDVYFRGTKHERSIIGTTEKLWDDDTLARGCSGPRSTSDEYPGIYQAGKAFSSLASGTNEYLFGYSHLYARIGTKDMAEISRKFTRLYGLKGENPGGMPVSSGQSAISTAIRFNLSKDAFVLVDKKSETPDILPEHILLYDFEDLDGIDSVLFEKMPEKIFLDLSKTPLEKDKLLELFKKIKQIGCVKEIVLANISPQLYQWLVSQESIDIPIRLVLSNIDQYGDLPAGNQWGWLSLFDTKKEFLPALADIKDYGANMSSMLAEYIVQNILNSLCQELQDLPGNIIQPKAGKKIEQDPRDAIVDFFRGLESAQYGAVTCSGMGAIYAAIMQSLPEEGGKVLYGVPAYGCTMDLSSLKLGKHNIKTMPIRLDDDMLNPGRHLKDFRDMVSLEKPDVVFLEPVVNPTCEVHDIIEAVKICYQNGVKSVVIDNTFLTGKSFSVLQSKELTEEEKGIIRIVYSGTKHTDGGRSGDTWGYVSARNAKEQEELMGLIEKFGLGMSAMPARIVKEKSLPTYEKRTDTQLENAEKFAGFLQGLTKGENPVISKVYYPGIGESNKLIAEKMLKKNGTMLAFDFNEKLFTKEDVALFLDMLALQSFFKLAVSLGKDYTLFENSYYQVHAFRPHEEKMRLGITPHCIRVSVGCENIEDIIREFTLLLVELQNKEHKVRLKQWVEHYKDLYDRKYVLKEIDGNRVSGEVLGVMS